jgi:hypothetical protein
MWPVLNPVTVFLRDLLMEDPPEVYVSLESPRSLDDEPRLRMRKGFEVSTFDLGFYEDSE